MSSRARDNTHFLIGAPRSGTTWLLNALTTHPRIICSENRLFGRFCELWKNKDETPGPRITLDEFIFTQSRVINVAGMHISPERFYSDIKNIFIDELLEYIRTQSGKNVIIDKVTPYLGRTPIVLDEIEQLFPEAKVINLVRDGRDVLTSGVFDWLLMDEEIGERHRFFLHPEDGTVMNRFFDDRVIKTWTKYWTDSLLPGLYKRDQVLTITYEQMILDQGSVLDKICKFIGVESDIRIIEKCVRENTFKIMSGGREAGNDAFSEKARKGQAGDWKNYFTRRDGELFNEHAGDLLVRYGYEESDDWVRELPDKLEYKNSQRGTISKASGKGKYILSKAYHEAQTRINPCPICNHNDFRLITCENRHAIALPLSICAFCGLVLINPRPRADWFEDFYKKYFWEAYVDMHVHSMEELFEIDKCKEKAEAIGTAILGEISRPSLRYLDVGCGLGALPDYISNNAEGWTVEAIEPSKQAVDFIHRTFNSFTVTNMSLDRLIEVKHRYDVVSIVHVLEHTLDPSLFLKRICNLLSEDGMLYVEVPNILSDKWQGKDFLHVAHTLYFDESSLRAALETSGYRVIKVIDAPEKKYWPWALGVFAARKAHAGEFKLTRLSKAELARKINHVKSRIRPADTAGEGAGSFWKLLGPGFPGPRTFNRIVKKYLGKHSV
jgi:2-polyprenyl-3-methyl-5-hydroxy-6-metoxy-1,4-benzoquinol methylase